MKAWINRKYCETLSKWKIIIDLESLNNCYKGLVNWNCKDQNRPIIVSDTTSTIGIYMLLMPAVMPADARYPCPWPQVTTRRNLGSHRPSRRSVRSHDLAVEVPRSNPVSHARSFVPSTAQLWNSLPAQILAIRSRASFSREVNRFLGATSSAAFEWFFRLCC